MPTQRSVASVATDNTWVDLSALCTNLGFCAELGSDILAELFNHSGAEGLPRGEARGVGDNRLIRCK
jgi:hypothetical protein